MNLLSNDFWIDKAPNMHHMDVIIVIRGVLWTRGWSIDFPKSQLSKIYRFFGIKSMGMVV